MNASNNRKLANTNIALLLLPALFVGCSGDVGGSDDAGGGSGTSGGNVPRANTDSAVMDEDSVATLDVLANDVAVVGVIDATSVTIVQAPTNGAVSVDGVTGEVDYTPDLNFHGVDSFSYQMASVGGASGTQFSNVATVDVEVGSVNDAPEISTIPAQFCEEVGCAQTVKQGENRVVINPALYASDVDVALDENDALAFNNQTVSIFALPAHGDLDLDPATGLITYTPDIAYAGRDEFQWTITDSGPNAPLTSVAAVVVIDVRENVRPVLESFEFTLLETGCASTTVGDAHSAEIDFSVLWSDSDGEVQPNSFNLLTPPLNGALDPISAFVYLYTPNEGFEGDDQLAWTVSDDDCDAGVPALVSFNVVANQAPVVADATLKVDEIGCASTPVGEEHSAVLEAEVLASDVDGTVDMSTFAVTTPPSKGGVVENVDGTITYTPNIGAVGTDSFSWTIQDDDCDSATGTVWVAIHSNTKPVSLDVAGRTDEDSSATLFADASDVDGFVGHGDLSQNVFVNQPVDALGNQVGTVTVEDLGGFGVGPWVMQWTPGDACGAPSDPDDLFGTITWEYWVEDDDCMPSDVSIATLDITPIGDGPEVSNDAVTTNKNIPIIIDVLGNDVEGGGWDTDGDCVDDSWEPLEQIDSATVTILSTGTGSVEVNDGLVTYLPDVNETGLGVDTFTYEVSDEAGHVSNVGTVTVTVEDANTAPTANADVYAITEDDPTQTFDVTLNDTDIDSLGDPSAWVSDVIISTQPEHGTVVIAGLDVEYTVEGNFCGVDSFEYYIQDTDAAFDPSSSNTTSVTITVAPSDDEPEVTLEDLVAYKNAGNGAGNQVAPETFFYDLSEGVNVGGEWDNGGGFDCGDSIVGYEFVVNPTTTLIGPARGGFTLDAATGQMTYTPQLHVGDGNGPGLLGTSTNLNDGDWDNDLFSYRAQDASGLWSAPIQVTIQVRDRNTPPRGVNDLATTTEDNAVEIDSIGGSTAGANADYQGDRCGVGGLGNTQSEFCGAIDSTTLMVVDQPANGTVEVFDSNPDPTIVENWFRYTPNPDFNGVDTFTYRVADDGLDWLGNPTITPLYSDDAGGGAASGAGVPGEDSDWTLTPVDMQPTVVQVTVDPVNDIPTGQDAGFACAEDGCDPSGLGPDPENLVVVNAADYTSDIDGTIDLATLVITSPAGKGTATITDVGEMTYTPNIGEVGADSWGWAISDNEGGTSAEITFSVDILPNMAPVSSATPSLSLREDPCATGDVDHTGTVDVGALVSSGQISDADGTLDLSITGVSITSAPSWGTASYDAGTQLITYVVNSAHTGGSDPFAFTVSDDDCDASSDIWVTVTVTPNEAPTLDNQIYTMDEGGSLLISLAGADADGSIDWSTLVVTPPAEGTLTDNGDGTLNYDAADECGDLDFFGSVSFTVSVNDEDCTSSNTANIDIDVTAVNDAPVVSHDSYVYSQGAAVESPAWATPAAGATVTAANLFGNDSDLGGNFSSDSSCLEDSSDADAGDAWKVGELQVFFGAAPATPDEVVGDVQKFVFNRPGTGAGVLYVDVVTGEFQLWPGTDLQADQGDPQNGTGANLDDLSWQCFSDQITFGYKRFDTGVVGDGSDSLVSSNLAEVSFDLDVTTQNDCPVSTDDVANVDKNDFTDIDMSANDFDTDGLIDNLSIVILTQPEHASSLEDNLDGTWRYEPDQNFIGIDTFAYAVQDLDGLWTAAATVTVTVADRNTPPTANADTGVVVVDGDVTIDVVANDVDVDDPLDLSTFIVPSTTAIVVAASAGTATHNGDGTITLDVAGAGLIAGNIVTLTYEVTDGGYLSFDPATSNQATVTVTVFDPLASMAGGNPQGSAKANSGAGLGAIGGPGGPGAPGKIKPVKPGPKQPVVPKAGPKAQVINGALYYVARVNPDEERDALFRMDQNSVDVLFAAAEEGGRIYDFAVEPHGRAVLIRGDVIRDGEISLLLLHTDSGDAKALDTGAPETGAVLEFRVTQAWRQVFYLCSGNKGLRRGVIELGLKTDLIDELKETR